MPEKTKRDLAGAANHASQSVSLLVEGLKESKTPLSRAPVAMRRGFRLEPLICLIRSRFVVHKGSSGPKGGT